MMNITEVREVGYLRNGNDIPDWIAMGNDLAAFANALTNLPNPPTKIAIDGLANIFWDVNADYNMALNDGSIDPASLSAMYTPFQDNVLDQGTPPGPENSFGALLNAALQGDDSGLVKFVNELVNEPATLKSFISITNSASAAFLHYKPK